jgi:hypothetical protein
VVLNGACVREEPACKPVTNHWMEAHHIRELVVAAATAAHRSSAAQSIGRLISAGELGPGAVQEVTRHLSEKPGALREELLDILMLAIREALKDHRLATEERELISQLKRLFQIREGDFYRLRRSDLQATLQAETRRLLIDEQIDTVEALHQVELQALFDLSYDQYLEVTRNEVSAIVDRLIERLTKHSEHADRRAFFQQLGALHTVYRLSESQREALAQAGLNLGASELPG